MASIASGMGNGRAPDLLRTSAGGSLTGTPLQLKFLGICWIMTAAGRRTGSGFTVSAKLRKVKKHEYPWPDDADPNVKWGVLSYLSPFKPLKEKQKPVALEFEKPLVDLQRKIIEVQKMANETGLDFTDQIVLLENKYQQWDQDPRFLDLWNKAGPKRSREEHTSWNTRQIRTREHLWWAHSLVGRPPQTAQWR